MPIRPLSPADTEAWLALRQMAWPEWSLRQHLTEMAAMLASPQRYAVFVSADEEGLVNGFVEVSLKEHVPGCTSSPVAYVEGWFVEEGARGRGIGRALMEAAMAWAQSRGCRELASDTDLEDEAAQAAHRALGFEEVERIIVYRRALTAPAEVPADLLEAAGPSPAPVPGGLAVGVDLVEIPRITRALERYGERFLRRVFTPAEVIYSRARPPELAARFAAKEAVSKALGVGMRILAPDGIGWQEVEVLGDWRGRPEVYLHGWAARRAAQLGLSRWAVSLSHAQEYAIAIVVAV